MLFTNTAISPNVSPSLGRFVLINQKTYWILCSLTCMKCCVIQMPPLGRRYTMDIIYGWMSTLDAIHSSRPTCWSKRETLRSSVPSPYIFLWIKVFSWTKPKSTLSSLWWMRKTFSLLCFLLTFYKFDVFQIFSFAIFFCKVFSCVN